MPTYTLTRVDPEPYVWKGEHGEFSIYTVQFKHPDGQEATGQIKTKSSSPAPTAGSVIEGELKLKDGFPPEIKKVFANGGGGFKGKTPEESNRIARMNSHAHALKYWELKHAANPEFGFASWADYTKVVDLFYSDVKGAS